MKAIIDTSQLQRKPNREQKRRFESQIGRKITMEEFENALLFYRLRTGQLDEKDLHQMAKNQVAHLDNAEAFPDGTEVMLNYEEISKRNHSDFTNEYWDWIEANKDSVMHLIREDNKMNLVCIEEDKRFDGDVQIPRFFFDMYADLLVKCDNKWVSPFEVDDIKEDMTEY